MLLEELTLCDFGLFSGEHHFALAPQRRNDIPRPIVLFGGLNGAGKTTILTAVRLALYGRNSVGRNISQRNYEEYLEKRIHKTTSSLSHPTRASVALEFRYFKQGEGVRYKVVRSWTSDDVKIVESLALFKNDDLVTDFVRDQCQTFLNELVPLGVSDLFFFDGERIADLAEDDGDVALRDAIRRLLGLDILERLSGDLYVFNRRLQKAGLTDQSQGEVTALEDNLIQAREFAECEAIQIATLESEIGFTQAEISRLEAHLAGRGGQWGESRQELIKRSESLNQRRVEIGAEILELISGLYPISLAPSLASSAMEQVRKEEQMATWKAVSDPLKKRMRLLTSKLSSRFKSLKRTEIDEIVESVLSPLVMMPSELAHTKNIHHATEREGKAIRQWFHQALTTDSPRAECLRLAHDQIDEEIAAVAGQLDRAPDQEALQADFDLLKQRIEESGRLKARQDAHREEQRKHLWKSIELVRALKRREIGSQSLAVANSSAVLATGARKVLSDFSVEIARRKIAKVESEFLNTLSRLARKDDAITRVNIDPATFQVTLYDKQGRALSKKDLSAGEKQIYAVAMLDALARTSGRKLPVIIDTPLGRLDSQHRANLVANYFPRASHQVIILSTDTEIDQTFYEALGDSTSHAYHLVYDSGTGSSKGEKGFFWRRAASDQTYAA